MKESLLCPSEKKAEAASGLLAYTHECVARCSITSRDHDMALLRPLVLALFSPTSIKLVVSEAKAMQASWSNIAKKSHTGRPGEGGRLASWEEGS